VLDDTVATAIAVGFRIFQTAIELLYVGIVVWLNRNTVPKVAETSQA
jgi:hypothetical protein